MNQVSEDILESSYPQTCPNHVITLASAQWQWFNYVQAHSLLMYTKKIFSKKKTKNNDALELQWNPSITDTFGDQHFVRYSEVSPSQGLSVYFR